MSDQVNVPKGEEKITVELTVKEALALAGIRFNNERNLIPEARKKLRHSVDDKLLAGAKDQLH